VRRWLFASFFVARARSFAQQSAIEAERIMSPLLEPLS
jgi:hypothetical protein